jgi:uncharacterized protein DUF4124
VRPTLDYLANVIKRAARLMRPQSMPQPRIPFWNCNDGYFPATAAALAVILLMLGGPAAAAMYKWVDANGRVSYSDQPPPGNVRSEVVNTSVAPSNPEAVKEMANQDADMKKRQSQRVEDQQKSDKTRQDEATRQQACAAARGQIRMFQSGVPMQRFNDKGEAVYMDENMKAKERDRIEGLIRERCAA